MELPIEERINDPRELKSLLDSLPSAPVGEPFVAPLTGAGHSTRASGSAPVADNQTHYNGAGPLQTPGGRQDLKISELGVTQVFAPLDGNPQADIVFVHGLNGHPENTWTAANHVFWPTDLLPKTLSPLRARILTYGYNANILAFGKGKDPSTDMIHQHAQTLVTSLDLFRYGDGDAPQRPILFVGHSLGGVLIKRALAFSAGLTDRKLETYRSVYVSTYAIVFLGTPHNGSSAVQRSFDDSGSLNNIVDAMPPLPDVEPSLVRALKEHSETLQNINLNFSHIQDRFDLFYAYETIKTDFGDRMELVVDQESAAPTMPGAVRIGIDSNHSKMSKFGSETSPGYKNISSHIKRCVNECPSTIQSRWVAEKEARKQRYSEQGRELLAFASVLEPGSQSSQTSAESAILGSNRNRSPAGSDGQPQKNSSISPMQVAGIASAAGFGGAVVGTTVGLEARSLPLPDGSSDGNQVPQNNSAGSGQDHSTPIDSSVPLDRTTTTAHEVGRSHAVHRRSLHEIEEINPNAAREASGGTSQSQEATYQPDSPRQSENPPPYNSLPDPTNQLSDLTPLYRLMELLRPVADFVLRMAKLLQVLLVQIFALLTGCLMGVRKFFQERKLRLLLTVLEGVIVLAFVLGIFFGYRDLRASLACLAFGVAALAATGLLMGSNSGPVLRLVFVFVVILWILFISAASSILLFLSLRSSADRSGSGSPPEPKAPLAPSLGLGLGIFAFLAIPATLVVRSLKGSRRPRVPSEIAFELPELTSHSEDDNTGVSWLL